jgi:nuclear pore complex protein Nup155
VASLTFEDLVTAVNGVSASRALVNILIDEQISQQVGVRAYITSRHTL